MADYVERVGNSIDEQPAVAASAQYSSKGRQPYPRARLRRLPLEEYRVGLLDFLDLDRCRLQHLVAQRNSGMGRVMPPSRQLVYEHRFLQRARACADSLDAGADTAFAGQLAEIIALKERNLPRVWFNATIGSEEFADLFAGQAEALALEEYPGLAPTIYALRYLAALGPRLGHPDLDLDPAVLEKHLQQLAAHRHGTRLLASIDLLCRHLDAAAQALEDRQRRQPVCLNGQPTPRARTLHNVFTKYYAGRIQPYMAALHTDSRRFSDALMRVVRPQAALMPSALATYGPLADPTQGPSPWARLDEAIARHTHAWQAVLTSCGMAPGQDGANIE